jgi:uncharacterized membrane protein
MARNQTEAATFIVVGCLGVFAVAVLAGFLFAFILMLAWNHVMPYLFDFKQMDYWQAYALYWVGAVIFGSLRGSTASALKNDR